MYDNYNDGEMATLTQKRTNRILTRLPVILTDVFKVIFEIYPRPKSILKRAINSRLCYYAVSPFKAIQIVQIKERCNTNYDVINHRQGLWRSS